MDRRTFLTKLLLTSGLGLGLHVYADDESNESNNSKQQTQTNYALANTGISDKHVVVIGGGMAGATVAKYLRLWGGSGIAVTLVEPNPIYVSNIMSNLVLSGGRKLTSLNISYANLVTKYGITLKQASLTSFDNTTKQVTLSDGSTLTYDRLIMATGIQLDEAYGLTTADYASSFPHAWQAGSQTAELAKQITSMTNGDTFVMTIPMKPYRCPPGPYERACLVADYLKSHNKQGAKVVVLDENAGIQAEPENFTTAFNTTHAGWIDYKSGVTNIQVDKTTRSITFNQGGGAQTILAKVINVIPPHKAPTVMLPLCNGGKWAPVNVLNYESTVTGMSGVHIIGDASQTTQPKAGHIANQEAKVCADAIIRAFQNQQPDPDPVTNSACFSPITNTTASCLKNRVHELKQVRQ